jgi:hypothetical protein
MFLVRVAAAALAVCSLEQSVALPDFPFSAAPSGFASNAEAATGGDSAGRVLEVDSAATEPATPLNLALRIRVLPPEQSIEISVTVAKRAGYPAEMFSARSLKAAISLPPGLKLVDGSLGWSGDLAGEDVAELRATVEAARDTEGVIEAVASGTGPGGSINADREEVRVSVRNGEIQVGRQSPVTGGPPPPGTGGPPQ